MAAAVNSVFLVVKEREWQSGFPVWGPWVERMAGQKRYGVCSGPVAGPPNLCCMSPRVSGGPCRGPRLTCAHGDPTTPWQASVSCTAVIRGALLESQAFSALCFSHCPVSEHRNCGGTCFFPVCSGFGLLLLCMFHSSVLLFQLYVSSANLTVFCHKVRRLALFCCFQQA